MAEPTLNLVQTGAYDASDEEQVRQRERSKSRRDKETREVLAQLLATRPGRNWMFSHLGKVLRSTPIAAEGPWWPVFARTVGKNYDQKAYSNHRRSDCEK